MKNELLTAVANVKLSKTNHYAKFSVSYQVCSLDEKDDCYINVIGTRVEAAAAIKRVCKLAKDQIFNSNVYKIYVSVNYDYTTVRKIKIDLHKDNW